MRSYQCNMCGTFNVNAFSAIHCCILIEQQNFDLFDIEDDIMEGDIVTIKNWIFYTCDNEAWRYKKIIKNNVTEHHPYFVVVSIHYDCEEKTKKYHLQSKMFDPYKSLSIRNTNHLIKIDPDTVPTDVFNAHQKCRLK